MNIDENRIKDAENILVNSGISTTDAPHVLQSIGFALLDEDIYPPKYRARCIQWDRTDDDGEHVDVDLPSEVVVTFEDLQLEDNATDEEIEDALSEYLTDYYGFCHNGFFFDKVNSI